MLWLMLIQGAFADGPVLEPEAQVRPRLEAHTGKDGVAGGDIGFFSQRSRLGAKLSLDDVSVRAVVQDVRMWGEEAHTLTDFNADNLDMHIATLGYALSDNVSLTVGRQEFSVHEHRLIGNVGWTQQARAFDGGLLQAKGEGWSADAAAFVLTARVPRAVEYDGAMGLVRAGWAPEGGQLDLLYYLVADGNLAVPVVHTTGLYGKGRTGALSGRAEAYLQFGENTFAYMAGVQGTLAPEAEYKPSITLWYDHLSGDTSPADGVNGVFNAGFGTNHKFYGYMDVMFFAVGAGADGQGLQDAALKLAMSPTEKITTKLDAHLFLAPAPIADPVLGEEVDLTASFQVAKGLGLGIGGAALMRPDRATDLWSYLQLDAKL